MKKLKVKLGIVAVMLMLVGVKQASAQEARSGIKGGLNLSNLYVDDVDDENVRVGFNAGIYTQIMIGETFAIQPELLYSAKGAKTEYDNTFGNGETDFNLNYIEAPILATFKLGDAADIHIGPYFGYLVSAKSKSTNETVFGDVDSEGEFERDNFNKFDYGLAGGIGFNFSALTIGLRYNYGLAEIAKSDTAEAFLGNSKNSTAQVYAAFNLQ